MEFQELVERLDDALQAKQFTIWRNVQISTEREAALLATRVQWNLARVPIHLAVEYVRAPYPEDFIALFQDGLDYSRKAFKTSRGVKSLMSGFAVIPLIVCDTALPQTIEWVGKHHGLWKLQLTKYANIGFDFYPVLYCLPTSKFYYWTGFSLVAYGIWPHSRRVIKSVIIPGVKDIERTD